MLEIELKRVPETLVEVSGVIPDTADGMSLREIRQQPVWLGNQAVPLGELFSVTGHAADRHHVWRGELSRVNGIGHGMSGGWIQVEGSAGNHLGSRMRDGTLMISGNAGDFAGAEMTGGLIHIRGNAGNSLGAACNGGHPGQKGGAILVDGSAGNLVGHAQRRGVIAVAGDVGNCCGWCVRAGTIVVCGQTGKNLGQEMVRGTIILTQEPHPPPAGFLDAGTLPMPVVELLRRYLHQLGFPEHLPRGNWRLRHGDTLHGARGEILVAA
jgi:formylmethanofuran dehydrogenase subunit C